MAWIITYFSQRYAGRQKPSNNRVNYVIHLQDHLAANKANLHDILVKLDFWTRAEKPVRSGSWIQEIRQDSEYLVSYIENTEVCAQDVRELVGQIVVILVMLAKPRLCQMQSMVYSRASYWSTLLAIIIAFYVPLDFTTVSILNKSSRGSVN